MSKMKLMNVRMGFATNSSSSHSIVYHSNPDFLKSETRTTGSFGWEWFLLTDVEDKARYCLADGIHPDDVAAYSGLSIERVKEIQRSIGEYDGIDHDSVGTANSFSAAGFGVADIFSDNIAILGGNDNSDEPDFAKKFLRLDELNDYKCQDHGLMKTFFNPTDGTKYRFGIENPLYSPAPELVDLKITDFCDYGCKYCYQGSTEDGIHGSTQYIKSVIDELANKNVFEIAFGGGETTKHPDFTEIITYARQAGVVPNFTTRNLKDIFVDKNDDQLPKNHIALGSKQAGAFAYSIDNCRNLSSIERIIERYKDARSSYEQKFRDNGGWSKENNMLHFGHSSLWFNRHKSLIKNMMVQVVLGTISESQFDKIVAFSRRTGIGITFLGYKTTGRGSEVTPKDDSWFPERMRKLASDSSFETDRSDSEYSVDIQPIRIGVDTCIVEKFRNELTQFIDKRLFTTTEGTHSMYVDAITQTGDVSSYTNGEYRFDFEPTGDWLKRYQENAIRESKIIGVG